MMMGSEKGSVLVIVITGITIIAAIGAGVASMINSSARTGVDQSLSVQALYAAESGLEWAGAELRDSADWITTCEDFEDLSEEDTPDIGQASFTITGEEKISPDGCEVTVTGSVGSLASRKIKALIPKKNIESSGGDVNPPEDADIVGGEDKELTESDLNIKKDKPVYVKKGTIITDDISKMPTHSKVYFGDDVKLKGGISIKELSEVYFGDNVEIAGTIKVGNNVLLCFGDNLVYTSFSTKPNSRICTKDGKFNYNCDDGYALECGEGEVSQNPVGTDDGTWSEG